MDVGRLLVSESAGDNVFVNQAIEAAIAETLKEDEIALYLWRNSDCVVMGRNQDAYAECDVNALESEGGLLARRTSGGGAVWHDLGNLNFSFVYREGAFSREEGYSTVISALSSLGVGAELGGRNDLMFEGGKLGGNAYYKRGGTELHHGTILVSTSPERVARFLTPPDEKFAGKGVRSVASRVTSLRDILEGVSAERVAAALKEAFFAARPGAEVSVLSPVAIGAEKIMRWTGFFSREEWRYGRKEKGSKRVSVTLFGERAVAEISSDGRLKRVYSDSLDADAVSAVNAALGENDEADIFENISGAREEAERLLASVKEGSIV